MTHRVEKDPSTLAVLRPQLTHELAFRRFKTSVRYHGSHRLALRRSSRQPESSRLYQPGDPVRHIDWKAFARTDQLIIRQQQDEASAEIVIVLQNSQSMAWPPEGDGQYPASPTKIDIAGRVAFNLAHAHCARGDFVTVQFWRHDSDQLPSYRPRSPANIVSMFHQWANHHYDESQVLEKLSVEEKAPKKADLCYWVGDLLDGEDYLEWLGKAEQRSTFHVLSSLETDPSWLVRDRCYFDETRRRKEYQGQFLQDGELYERSLERWFRRLRTAHRRRDIEYQLVTDRTPISLYQGMVAQIVERSRHP